jgi:hypothetical protein
MTSKFVSTRTSIRRPTLVAHASTKGGKKPKVSGPAQPKVSGTPRLRWNSSTHPISDLRDWSNGMLLEIRPDFQRREVWSEAAKISLIDTIVRNIPMPKLFVQAQVRPDQKTYRVVIDGQQRITSILDFLHDKFILNEVCPSDYRGKRFSDLSATQRDDFLYYQVDLNEVVGASDEQVREIYSRVNKYTKQLTKQELRRADFPGDFLSVSEKLAALSYFETAQVFGTADLRRMGDVEFVSELIAGLLSGMQEKKTNLDAFYQKYAQWPKPSQTSIMQRFEDVIHDIAAIFNEDLPIAKTRFRQKADFYSLFFALDELRAQNLTLKKDRSSARKDLAVLDEHIAPTSHSPLFSAYAVRCVSDANSAASRRWRTSMVKGFVGAAYRTDVPAGRDLLFLVAAHADLINGGEADPPKSWDCPICKKKAEGFYLDLHTVAWPAKAKSFHLANLSSMHLSCAKKAPASDWMLPSPLKLPKPSVWLEE